MQVRIRTVEENIRLVREAAIANVPKPTYVIAAEKSLLKGAGGNVKLRDNKKVAIHDIDDEDEIDNDGKLPNKVLRLKIFEKEASIFITCNEIDPEVKPEYIFENLSASHYIHYKQKGVTGNNWCSLAPGQQIPYIWEDPFRPHKLMVKAGRNVLFPRNNSQIESDFLGVASSMFTGGLDCITEVVDAVVDDLSVVSWDEVQRNLQKISLPCGSAGNLMASVSVAGGSGTGKKKTLSIAPTGGLERVRELIFATTFLEKQRSDLQVSVCVCIYV